MSGLRGWLWTVAAVAGTATAAALVYRYSTRSLRSDGERGGTGAAQDAATADTSDGEASEYELFSDEEEHTQELEQQQLVLVAREGNMLLSVFGIVLLLLVVSVSLIVTWTSDEPVALTELPMFTPLVWIALGIFTAAAVEMVTHSGAAPSEVPVLADKTVFPHDESDFELIHRHEEAAPAASSSRGNDDRLRQSVDVEEEKEDAPAELTAIVKRADELFAQNNHPGTRSFLRSELPKYPKNIDVLWRLARACNYLVDESSNADEKKALAFEGLAYAEKAYSADSNSAAANKWMGIMTSTVGNFRDLKDKIAGAYVIRDHIQRAIELDSSDATSHNILGQWCLAFADMTWIEKRAAAALFGTPPTATYAEAIDHFLAAERISPGFWKKNVFLLAQTYAKMKIASEAAVWVKKAYQVPVKTKEDEEVQREVMALMKQLRIPVP